MQELKFEQVKIVSGGEGSQIPEQCTEFEAQQSSFFEWGDGTWTCCGGWNFFTVDPIGAMRDFADSYCDGLTAEECAAGARANDSSGLL